MNKEIVRENTSIIALESEIEIVQAYASDLRTAEVAQKLDKNERTMEFIISGIKRKFGRKTIHGLVSLFYKHKLIS